MKKRLKQAAALSVTAALTLSLPLYGTAGAAASHFGTAGNMHLTRQLHSQQQQQLQSLTSQALKPAFISPKLNLSSGATVKVIVQLSAQPTSVGRFAASEGNRAFSAESTEASINAQQTSVLNAAKAKGIDLTVNYQFNTVLNGMEVSIPANKISELAKIPGVVSVYENQTYHAIPDLAADDSDPLHFEIDPIAQVGADQAWAKGYTGRGMKVGVIDTGVDYLHPDLAENFKGGYDSFFNDDDPYEEAPIDGHEGTSHGTHVSGTIAGSASNPTSDIVQKGIAYESELHVYKVLGYDPATGRASGSSAQVIDGIERAVKDGMDVINLSLGSDAEKDPNSPDAIAINNAVLAGVTAVIANGNAAADGHYYYSMGSPASSQLAISVGAVTSTEKHYTASVTSSFDNTLTYPLNVMGWSIGQDSDFAGLMGAEPIDGVYVGIGKESDFAGKDVAGKVAFISRGDLAFVDKIANAKRAGAKAVVIFNGISIGTGESAVPDLSDSIPGRDGAIDSFLGNSYDFLPTFDMEGAAGRALARSVLANPDTPLQFTFGSEYPQTVIAGDHMADFSSRGPASDGSFGIKPDVVAPGVNILSTWPAYKKFDENASYDQAYNRISGTSMATPHIAGLALLIKQAHPNWTPFDIRAALANTADEITDEDGVQYDVYSQGAGRANVLKAIETNALLQTVDPLTILDKNLQPQQVTNYNDNASFGLMAPGADAKTETLQLKNTGSAKVTYSASVVMHPSVTSDPADPIATPDVNNIEANLLLLDNNTISAAGHSAKQFALQVQPSADAAPGVYEGEVLLTSSGDKPALHIPFSVHVGTEDESTGFGLQNLQLSNTIISPDGDGVNDSTELSFDLTAADVNYMEINYYGLDDQLIGNAGVFAADQDNDGNLDPIDPQPLSVELDGSYTDDEVDANDVPVEKHLTAGTYKIEVLAAGLDSNFKLQTEVYSAYKTLGVSDPNVDLSVEQAKDQFVPNITNTKVLGKPVLTLPTTEGIAYQVVASDKQDYISSAGNLVSLAGIPQGGSIEVNLTVRISSSVQPSMAMNVTVPVRLVPKSTGGGGGGVIGGTGETNQPSSAVTSVLGVINQGQSQVPIAPVSKVDGNAVTFSITDKALSDAVGGAGQSPVAIVISNSITNGQQAQFELSASQVKTLQGASEGTTVVVSTQGASLALPVSALKRVPAESSLKIVLKEAADSKASFTSAGAGTTVIGTPVSFEVFVVTGSESAPLAVDSKDYVKRSFLVSGDLNSATTGVLYLEGDKVQPVSATFTHNSDGTNTVVVNRPGFSVYAAASNKVAFTDIGTSYAQDQIKTLAAKFLLNGTSAASFSPKKNVTRAEFAAMLVRALGLTPSTETPFGDVSSSAWYAKDVAAVHAAGLVNGYEDGNFHPNAEISRQELAVMLSKALQLLHVSSAEGPKHVTYGDEQSFGSFAKASIQVVTDSGLMKGSNVGAQPTFSPTQATTREAAAMVLYALLQKSNLMN